MKKNFLWIYMRKYFYSNICFINYKVKKIDKFSKLNEKYHKNSVRIEYSKLK